MSTSKLVVVLSTIFRVRGGIPRFNQMLCLALDDLSPRLGLEVKVVSQDDAVPDYLAHGEPWRHAAFLPGGGKYGVMGRTLALCLGERPDLMLVGLLGMTPVGALCSPLVRRGFGFVAHGFECWGDHPLADLRRTRHWAARRARFVFSVSSYTGKALSRMTGIRPEVIHLLPNTLEPRFEVFRDDEALGAAAEAEGPEVLTVSRLWPEERMKGVDHMLEAFARLASRYPRARYRIVGKGGDKPRLLALAASLGLDGRVLFQEDVPDADLAELYRHCAVFALPSGQEGFGIVFLEAMRFAKPCIGGDAGGTPEVIEHGRTGLLVPHGDVDALAAALDRLLADPNLRRELGLAGRRRLLEHFTFERFRERLSSHLGHLLGGSA